MSSYQLTWRPLHGGHLAIGHRPGRRLREALAVSEHTHTLSLLSHRESRALESDARLRLPLDSADPPGPERRPEIIAVFDQIKDILADGGHLYIHCSAGLHRTGMITHAFLRYLGATGEDALEVLTALRPLTAREVKAHRLAWGDQFALA